jgi:hypothetical protein
MPTPPDQPIPPVRKVGPTPRPKIVKPPSLAEALKASLDRINQTVKASLIGQLCSARGSANAADVAIISKELQKLPLSVLLAFQKAGCKVVVCRNSVVEVRPDLKGVVPRGWEGTGRTWDSVPGTVTRETKEVIVAVVGHGTKAGPHYPHRGEGHNSASLLVHEMYHALDATTRPPHSASADFTTARTADLAKLGPYERQAALAGREETYAESAARYFAGEHGDATKHPHLHQYWESNELSPRERSGPAAGGK